jgi:3-hydroxyisobutyrate dehydrogenase-like beta-hydroxyacid dehydrogenase
MTARPVIAVIAAGDMGSAVGARLAEQGCTVLTSLAGRSAASRTRAQAAAMADASDAQIAAADMILSIVPPGDALALAERLAPAMAAAARKPIYVDCNAVSPATVRTIAAAVEASGAPFVDAGIVGGPPKPGYTPTIYASGPAARGFAALTAHGLDIRVMDGPVGQASALKMCYAGLTKGLHAVGVAVIRGAIEAGIEEPFFAELASSQPMLLDYFVRRTPGVFVKTYRWVAEMQEIGAFLGGPGETIYDGAAALFDAMARDHAGSRTEEAELLAFLGRERLPKPGTL